MDPADAAIAVLQEAGEPLHWTVIQDRALKRGYLDPFSGRDVRRELLAALSVALADGRLVRPSKGVYGLP